MMRMQRRRVQAALLLAGGVLVVWLWPLPKALLEPLPQRVVTVTDRHGELLYRDLPEGSGKSEPLHLNDVPDTFIGTLLATEDRTFYSHLGISVRGIARALVRNVRDGGVHEGGSTLTQQYVRLRLGRNRSVIGKLWEMLYALKLERVLTKDEILERYLNTASFGQGTVGLGAASSALFGKTPKELSLSEEAFLVGLLQSPTTLDPRRNFSGAKKRQELVLSILPKNGVASVAETEEAKTLPIHLRPRKTDILAPHFVFWVRGEHPEMREGELRTTLDAPLQREVEDIVRREVEKLRDKRVSSAAVVVVDVPTGDILAMVGSVDYFSADIDGAVNVAVSPRQPGSALKPFTYALALERGWTPATVISDISTQFLTEDGLPYTPRNYDFTTHGPVSVREALGNSLNIAATRTLSFIGVGNLLQLLQKSGISSLSERPEHYGLALTLGAGEVSLLELVRSYGLLARGGETFSLRSAEHDAPMAAGARLLDPRTTWLISDILSDASARLMEFGENGPLQFSFPVAAKTGTTRNSRDNWAIGYTPKRIVGVWVGNADNTPMKDTSGVTGAGPIFHAVMEASMRGQPKKWFERPGGIVEADVCRLTGKKPSSLCPGVRREYFVASTEPREVDDTFRVLHIDPQNGLLVPQACKAVKSVEEVFAYFPAELRGWAREHGWNDPPSVVTPACEQGDTSSLETGEVVITQPSNGDRYKRSKTIPPNQQAIIFKASATVYGDVEWSVDGAPVGLGKGDDHRLSWMQVPGRHRIRASVGNTSDEVEIEIVDPE